MIEKIFLNPITKKIKDSINISKKKLNFAVPFISGFAKKIISAPSLKEITDKRLITRFDESNINTFNIPALEYLLDVGFEICYNNKIHLKLYITDEDAFITSSNLTNGGFENNVELTVRVDDENHANCQNVFDNLWTESISNMITKNLISENWGKYEVLRRRQKFEKKKVPVVIEKLKIGSLDIQLLIDHVFSAQDNYDDRLSLIYLANKSRNELKRKLISNGFDLDLFYAPKGHPNRKNNLFHNIVYGIEKKLAGTGLFEKQIRTAFEHKEFKNVISFILPESVGLEPWNLDDNKSFSDFCNGLFDFDIPQYSTTIPIRLASYFYPEHFVHIFKLDDLQKASVIMGIDTNARSNGERLYAYNMYLKEEMKDVPYSFYIKSGLIYKIYYAVELNNRLEENETYEDVLNSYNKRWIRNYIEKGKEILEDINSINK